MSRAYYYFAASLPMLDFDGDCPLSVEDFLEDCRRLLAPEDFRRVRAVLSDEDKGLDGNGGPFVYRQWRSFQRRFLNEQVWFRAEEKGVDPWKFIEGDYYSDPVLREAVHQAAKMDNLLEAERFLDRIRWRYLDELCAGHYYDLDFILTYAVKLQILERHQRLASCRGREIFDQMKLA